MKAELHHCVITPNHQRLKRRSVTISIPAGTPIIESFSIVRGKRVVNETLIASVGIVRGSTRKP